MKISKFKPSSVQILYLIIYFILFSFIIYTPTLINGPVSLSKKLIIEEETFEGALIAVLFLLSIWIFNLYKADVNKHKEMIKKAYDDKKKVEERLNESDQYIGMINVQIQEINLVFNNISKYPETKSELKQSFRFFGERILAIVNVQWVLFRIIDSVTQRTIFERNETKYGNSFSYPQISNRMIIQKQPVSPFTCVISSPQNLKIIAVCVIPAEKISSEQQIFIQAIINEITKLFVILNSSFYKKEDQLFFENKQGIKKTELH